MSFASNLENIIKQTDLSHHANAADRIFSELQKNDPDRGFLVIVYDPVSGWSNHGVSSGNHTNFFRIKGTRGEANVVVLWTTTHEDIKDNGATLTWMKARADIGAGFFDQTKNIVKTTFNALKDGLKAIISGSSEMQQEYGWMMANLVIATSLETTIGLFGETSKGRSLWMAKRYQGVEAKYTSGLVHWVVGDAYTMATMTRN